MTDKEYRKAYEVSKYAAQKMLFDEYINYVYTIVFSMLRSVAAREDIDECVSDTFADIYSGYNTNSSFDGDLKGYIAIVARRNSANYFKRLNSGKKSCSIDELSDTECGSDISVESEKAELRRILIQKTLELGEPDSTIVFQKYFCGRNSKEIAKMVSLNPATVRMRCTRAVRKLKTLLADVEITEEDMS